jgi:hypothetical protein
MNRPASFDDAQEHEFAKRELCIVCRRSAIPNEHTDQGPLCRHCKDSATEIRQSWIIGGRTYTKNLKGRLSAVESPKKGKSPVRSNGAELRKENRS